MARIEDAVNVGTGLAAQLRELGIDTIEGLRDIGSKAAWERLYEAGMRDDVPTRLSLEGAVRGVRWKELTPQERQDLADEVEQATGA